MRLPDFSQDESGDDLVFDPALERQRLAEGTEEYLEELRRDFAKYTVGKDAFPESVSKLSSALREWMLSFDRTNFYDRLAREFGLQGSDRIGIARIAWEIVSKSDWSPSPELFQKYISTVSVIPELAKRFAVDFIPKARELSLIVDTHQRLAVQNVSIGRSVEQDGVNRVEISLMQALGKFEKLGGQQVTNSKIVVKGQNDPVRPTIFNWLRAYRDELGVGTHDAVARGQFLFHSLNGKGLSSDERDQVGLLLKSLDENTPLTIDAGRQEVVFRKQIADTGYQISDKKQSTNALASERQSREQIQNTKYQIQDTDKNISRAVFELPHVSQQVINNTTHSRQQVAGSSQQITGNREQGTLPHSVGTESVAGRQSTINSGQEAGNRPARNDSRSDSGGPSAFEQAKAIQEANRASRVSMANPVSQTVELGAMNAVSQNDRPSVEPLIPRQSISAAPHESAPAPRAISFEPAKINSFSFGESPARSMPSPQSAPGNVPVSKVTSNDNVGEMSFSTKHVMPAEKEKIEDNRKQEMPKAERPLPRQGREQAQSNPSPTQTRELPLERGAGENTSGASVRKIPIVPQMNRYRITPTGRRDTPASDDTPSPHVVDLRS